MEKTGIVKETKWAIDLAHSEIGFKVRHLMISNVKGSFRKFDASIYTMGDDFTTASVDLWIEVASINTGEDKRDAHLKSADFLDAPKYRKITFSSSSLGKADSNKNQELIGELTIRDITRSVKLNVQFGGTATDPWGNEKAGLTVTGKINRNDWGLVWNTPMAAGGLMVGDEISITCEIELVKHVNASDNLKPEA